MTRGDNDSVGGKQEADIKLGRRDILRTTGAGAVGGVGAGQTGATETTAGGDLQWTFSANDWVSSSPTVVNRTVYVGSGDGAVYALDRETGQEEWRNDLGRKIFSSPAVDGESVFVGTGHWSIESAETVQTPESSGSPKPADRQRVTGDDADGFGVVALDAEEGVINWEFKTGIVQSSPTVTDGAVYFGSFDGSVYAVNKSTGTLIWEFETDGEVRASPTINNGTVYISSYDGSLYALDAETGATDWTFDAGRAMYSSPTVADGNVYVGSWNDDVYALDASTGDPVWEVTTGGSVLSSPTVLDGTVYVSNEGGAVYALDASTGGTEWEAEAPGVLAESSPTVADGILYAGTADGQLFAVDTASGETDWTFEAERFVSSPTVVSGTVYVGNRDGSVYALDAGVEGSSEGSRVAFGTLGHHHLWGTNLAVTDRENGIVTLEESALFEITSHDPGDIKNDEITWKFGDGTVETGFTSRFYSYESPGEYTVTVEALGMVATTSIRVVDGLGFRYEPAEPVVGDTVDFFAAGGSTSYAWDFDGNGDIDAEGPSASHVYSESGIYDVTVDSGGESATRQVTVDSRAIRDLQVAPRELIIDEVNLDIAFLAAIDPEQTAEVETVVVEEAPGSSSSFEAKPLTADSITDDEFLYLLDIFCPLVRDISEDILPIDIPPFVPICSIIEDFEDILLEEAELILALALTKNPEVDPANVYVTFVPTEDLSERPWCYQEPFVVAAEDEEGTRVDEREAVVPDYETLPTLAQYDMSVEANTVEISDEYQDFDGREINLNDAPLWDEWEGPVNSILPISNPGGVTVLEYSFGYESVGGLDLNTGILSAGARSTSGIKLLGSGIEAQVGARFNENRVGTKSYCQYGIDAVSSWVGVIVAIDRLTQLEFSAGLTGEIPNPVPGGEKITVGGEISAELSGVPALVVRAMDEDPENVLPADFSGDLAIDGSFSITGTVDPGFEVSGSIGMLLHFVTGGDWGVVPEGLLIEFNDVSIGIGPADFTIGGDDLVEYIPGISTVGIEVGNEDRLGEDQLPCWQLFDFADDACGEYPDEASATSDRVALAESISEGQRPEALDDSPPAESVLPGTDAAVVNRLTDRELTDTKPSVAARENGHVAVWERQTAGQTAFETDIIVAERESNGLWGEPTTLTDASGERYHSATVETAGQTAAAVWVSYDLSQSGSGGPEQHNETDQFSSLELVFETNSGWSDPVTVAAGSEWSKSSPVLASLDDERWVVAWVQTDAESFSQENLAYAVVDNGTVVESETIPAATAPAMVTTDNGVVLAYLAKEKQRVRRDRITVDGRTSEAEYDTGEIAVDEIAVSSDATVWVTVTGPASIWGYYAEGETVEPLTFADSRRGVRSVALTETTVGTALTYRRTGTDENDGDVRALAYRLRFDEGWSQERILASGDATKSIVSDNPTVTSTAGNGGLLALLTAGLPAAGAVEDVFEVTQPFRPTYTTTASSDESVAPGEETTVTYSLQNTGDLSGEESFLVEARSGSETLAETQEPPLDRGETTTGELPVTVDETGTVDVVAGREMEFLSPEKRRDTVEIATPRLVYESITVTRPEETTGEATIRIRNSGYIAADGFSAALYSGDALLGDADIDGVPAEDSVSVTIEFDMLNVSLTDIEKLRIDSDEELPDSHLLERSTSLLIVQPDIVLGDTVEYQETADGVAATVRLTNRAVVPVTATVRAVRDDETIGVKDATLTGTVDGVTGTKQVTVLLEDVVEGETVRFVVESNRTDSGPGIPTFEDEIGPVLEEIAPPALPGFENTPRDPDGDGLYEDIDGDGEVTIFDVQALFSNLDSPVVQNNSRVFNFSGSDESTVSIVDVQALFDELNR